MKTVVQCIHYTKIYALQSEAITTELLKRTVNDNIAVKKTRYIVTIVRVSLVSAAILIIRSCTDRSHATWLSSSSSFVVSFVLVLLLSPSWVVLRRLLLRCLAQKVWKVRVVSVRLTNLLTSKKTRLNQDNIFPPNMLRSPVCTLVLLLLLSPPPSWVYLMCLAKSTTTGICYPADAEFTYVGEFCAMVPECSKLHDIDSSAMKCFMRCGGEYDVPEDGVTYYNCEDFGMICWTDKDAPGIVEYCGKYHQHGVAEEAPVKADSPIEDGE